MAEALPAFCCGTVAILVVALASSFATLSPTEMALEYNFITQTVGTEPQGIPGLYFLGPFTDFLRFPTTIRTLNFDKEHRDLLDGRTSDGLPLILGVSFQYKLNPIGVWKLYHDFGMEYEQIFQKMGIHLITEMATHYTAYQFFNEKQRIASEMQVFLDEYFQKNLQASVVSLQIGDDDLPMPFYDAVLKSATTKQNITRMSKLMSAKSVEFETLVKVAYAQANVTIQKAMGARNQIMQAGKADAAVIEAFTTAETDAYGTIMDELGLKGDALLDYIWYDNLGGGGVGAGAQENTQVLVGVSPAAYISNA